MPEFEAAGLDYRAATLAARHAALWIAGASLAVSAIVGGAQCYLIWRGLRTMERASDARDRQLDAAEKRHAESMAALAEERRANAARHEEAMKAHAEAMKAGAERHEEAMKTGAERHEEAMKAGSERHAEAMAALEEQRRSTEAQARALEAQARALDARTRSLDAQTRSLETLLERTAPKREEDG